MEDQLIDVGAAMEVGGGDKIQVSMEKIPNSKNNNNNNNKTKQNNNNNNNNAGRWSLVF